MQGELERAVSALTGSRVRIIGAGRTDAGVHARGQVVNFRLPGAVPIGRVQDALNRGLPPDIAVLDVAEAPPEFHARFDAISRIYEYTILNCDVRDVLQSRYVWHIRSKLDVPLMRQASELFLGTHDFSAFGVAEKGRSPLRDLMTLEVRSDNGRVCIVCQANAFLQHMARGTVGALVDVGTGRKRVDSIAAALERPTESEEFTIAPPMGLCLTRVEYLS